MTHDTHRASHDTPKRQAMSAGGVPPTPPDHNILKPSTLRAWCVL